MTGKRHFGKISPINFLYQSKISSWHQVAKLKMDQQENGEKEIRVLGSEGIVVNALNLRPCASCRQSQTFKLDLGRQKS